MTNSMTVEEMNAVIRKKFKLRPLNSAKYFNKEEIALVLEHIGYSLNNLPTWWTKTKAGVTHPGRENHVWIMSRIRWIETQKKKSKVQKKKKQIVQSAATPQNVSVCSKCETHKDVEKWVHNVIKHECPTNMAGMSIEESDNHWSVTFTISKK